MSAVVQHETREVQVAPERNENPVMDMIRQAVAAGQPLDVIRELKDMAKELAADEAQRAFNVAFAAFKAEAIQVVRNKEVTDGPLRGRKYAELVSFVEAAVPALSKHGLSHSWEITRDDKDWIEVTCIIEHSAGGSKRVSQGGPPDSGGAKNALQARISTVTYLQRATFKSACGLAEKGDDDDGASDIGGEAITDQQVMDLRDLVESVAESVNSPVPVYTDNFLKFMKVERIEDIVAKDYQKAITAINSTRAGK